MSTEIHYRKDYHQVLTSNSGLPYLAAMPVLCPGMTLFSANDRRIAGNHRKFFQYPC